MLRGQAGHGEGLLSLHAEEIIRISRVQKIRGESSLTFFIFIFFKYSLSSGVFSRVSRLVFRWKCHSGGGGGVFSYNFFFPSTLRQNYFWAMIPLSYRQMLRIIFIWSQTFYSSLPSNLPFPIHCYLLPLKKRRNHTHIMTCTRIALRPILGLIYKEFTHHSLQD